MRAMRADFGPAPSWPNRCVVLGIGVAVLLSVMVGNRLWHDYARLVSALDSGRAAASQLAELARPAPVPSTQADSPNDPEARKLVAMARFDLDGTLRAIESTQLSGVRVTELSVDTLESVIDITLDVDNAVSATAYVAALNLGEGGLPWQLLQTQHQGSTTTATVRRKTR